ncbi:uncharacterized protein LOC112128105 [Cimex lectularius]|uniref:Uncharacterized protein n=1 Tax=Cimex lectularius TaxID=79782 RepID=A0A8I6SU95_CIMLE|nr:uncharacterized protein LOC112128105 [Cimex lectularius]
MPRECQRIANCNHKCKVTVTHIALAKTSTPPITRRTSGGGVVVRTGPSPNLNPSARAPTVNGNSTPPLNEQNKVSPSLYNSFFLFKHYFVVLVSHCHVPP